MISLIPSKASGPRLLLISAGILLFANGALAAEPVPDAHEQARQIIVGKPNVAVAPGSKTNGIAAVTAQDNRRGDPHEQARQVILGKPNVEPTSGSKGGGAVAARTNRAGHSESR